MARAISISVTEKIVRRDRLIVFVALGFIVFLAGLYTVLGVGMDMSALEMTHMSSNGAEPMAMASMMRWTPSYLALVALMWWIMMIAMMTPSAAPTILLFSALKRIGKDGKNAHLFSATFLFGYLVIWGVFAISATLLQWGLGSVGLVDISMMTISSKFFAGLVLICAGLYQFSPVKNACLEHCRSPASFLTEHNRPGLKGAFNTGARHGVFCLGCCWAIMALLFVGGIMNLYWITGLAVYVVVEKFLPNGKLVAKVTGAALVTSGVILVFASGAG